MDKPSKEERILPPFKKATAAREGEEQGANVANTNDFGFFGLAHNQASPIGFKVYFAQGNIAAVHYHDLVSPITFDGSGLIELRTPYMRIKITGKNLQMLFDHLFENRVAWIKEPDASFLHAADDQPEIESIKLECKD